jgi:hypothetical protein
MTGEAGGEAKAIAVMKKRGGPLAGRKPSRRETQSMLPKSLDPDVSNNLSIQMSVTTTRSATSVNSSAEAIFWTTFILPDTVASMPTQAAPRIRRASTE